MSQMNEYKTPNLNLAGYFAHEGIHPDSVVRTGEMRSRPGASVFAFCYDVDKYDKIKELERKYYDNQAKVDPRKYEYEKKALKERLDTEEEMLKNSEA